MVWKVIKSILFCCLLFGAICTSANAENYSVYDEGTMNTTYVTYFKDIVSGIDLKDNYVAFRSGQYAYTLLVGDLEFSNGIITLNGAGKEYEFSSVTTSGYNQQYRYYVREISDSTVNCGNYIIYSDVGDFPELVERGAKYEIITALLFGIMLLSIVINRIFFHRR